MNRFLPANQAVAVNLLWAKALICVGEFYPRAEARGYLKLLIYLYPDQ